MRDANEGSSTHKVLHHQARIADVPLIVVATSIPSSAARPGLFVVSRHLPG